MPNDIKYKQMAAVMKALAHPTRLFILDQLNQREHHVGELTELVGIDMSTMSRHLAVLKNAGIIDCAKQNNMMIYKLLCPCVLDIYQCVVRMREQVNG